MHLDSVQLRDPLATDVIVSLHELSEYMKQKSPMFSMSDYVFEVYTNARQQVERDNVEVSVRAHVKPRGPGSSAKAFPVEDKCMLVSRRRLARSRFAPDSGAQSNRVSDIEHFLVSP